MKRSGDQSTAWLILSSILICASVSHVAMAKSSSLHQSPDQMAPGKVTPVMQDNSVMLTKVKLKFAGQEAVLELNDSQASRDLVSMLPLTMKFSDYNNVEKIAYPPRKLSTEAASFGLKPSVGDFALYAPWGNLVVYYRSFQSSGDLVHLGRFISGIEQLAAMDGEFSVRLEVSE
ncbi:cyclophilin-like fold protein [Pseudomonas sp. HS6]|uniref:cyclophilin-like fold protein n=1 Tax=Pseudomonas sp. HS6 TaxID=2850559 RepID=UPI002018BCFC|nr:cyclophilin-like fold protein [Pseudomonas sp. HS6]